VKIHQIAKKNRILLRYCNVPYLLNSAPGWRREEGGGRSEEMKTEAC
jgi:hypothetical protein